jgi:hypothetical protein
MKKLLENRNRFLYRSEQYAGTPLHFNSQESFAMDNMFRMKSRKSNGNLHLRLEGIFDGGSAMALTAALREQYMNCDRLFIDTERLEEVESFGAFVLQNFLRQFPGVSQRVIFKGEKGALMALEGQRVLRVKEHHHGCGCSGRCAECKCAQRGKEHDAGSPDEKESCQAA